MGPRAGPAIYLSGMTLLGVAAALLFILVVGKPPTATMTAAETSPSAAARSAASQPQSSLPPTPAQTEPPRPSRPPIATAPPSRSAPSLTPTPSPSPTSTPAPTATPLPDWFLIPPDFGATATDWDSDGLSNDEEDRIGTDTSSWDTDHGGESDGAEVAAGRRPLDREDDVPPKSACIPEGARNWDGSGPDEEPPPAPELEAVLPDEIAGEPVRTTSMVGLPRRYGFFNYFWDALLLCAGGQPEDLSHAIGFRGTLPGLAILAVRVHASDMDKLGRDLLGDLELGGGGRRVTLPQQVEGRDVAFLFDADVQGLSFAAYVADDTLFLMTGMSATDAGFWPGGSLDPEHVREAVLELPRP